MRFPRNAKIFRGQLDFAPLAGVFFVLLIFILLTSVIYTPGIPFNLNTPPQTWAVSVNANGSFRFEKRDYRWEELRDRLRDRVKTNTTSALLLVKNSGPVPREAVDRLSSLAQELHLDFSAPDAGIDLPRAGQWSGTTNPTVIVSVNFGGQFFYENQRLAEADLRKTLAKAADDSKRTLTLVVLADKAVSNEVLARLGEIARSTGIREMVVATQPRPFTSVWKEQTKPNSP
jgi:biopolymer transport protein ExbD